MIEPAFFEEMSTSLNIIIYEMDNRSEFNCRIIEITGDSGLYYGINVNIEM